MVLRRVFGAGLCCTLAVLVSGVVLARQLERLEKSSCTLPESLAGVAGHVLVRYTVNEAGKVNFVQPAFAVAEPPEKQQALIDSVVSCVGGWSYRPPKTELKHSVSGNPTFSVELLQAFHYFKPGLADTETVEIEDGKRAPKRHIDEMRALKLKLARTLIEGSDRAVKEGKGWTVETNVRPKDRELLLGGVSFAIDGFGKVFETARPLPETEKLTLLLFGKEDEFNQVAAFDNLFRGAKPAGQYTSWDRMAYTFAAGREHPLKHSLNYVIHETTHHLVYQQLASKDRQPPYWVNEGIATYMELLKPDKSGAFELFPFKRGRQVEGNFSWNSKAEGYLEAFDRHVKAGTLPDLARFMGPENMRMEVDLLYGLSWLLTHYMINGENGSLRKTYEKWLTEGMGSKDDPGFPTIHERTPDQILEGLKTHVVAMKRSR